MFAPGAARAMADFHSSNEVVAQLLVSIYVVGLAAGPLVLSPLSELYGRNPIMHTTNLAFVVGGVLCAVSVDVPMLILARLLMGISTISLGGGYVADLMAPEDRGRALNIWNIGPSTGTNGGTCRWWLHYPEYQLAVDVRDAVNNGELASSSSPPLGLNSSRELLGC
ncbi:hypothetical protein TI39_contig4126g00022 [Zymoseptoria brevis]|uniref:Major facilitator superfamily (MFS) profile domain-containing protein n=1 Tax=Zymoseptoria brevis TaxID=1047168 RepID=A0A0F4GCW1_9PEZI|nr:hypothetical protein TI39_contig4126g00022 [Zymoseptoria brevis]